MNQVIGMVFTELPSSQIVYLAANLVILEVSLVAGGGSLNVSTGLSARDSVVSGAHKGSSHMGLLYYYSPGRY